MPESFIPAKRFRHAGARPLGGYQIEELSRALTAHLDEITRKIIRDEVHEATQDAEEISEPRQLR